MPLQMIEQARSALFACEPAGRAVISWNTQAATGTIELRVGDSGTWWTDWLPLASWDGHERRSHSPQAGPVQIEIDTLVAQQRFTRVEVRASSTCDVIACTTPFGSSERSSVYPSEDAHDLLVPERTQYVVDGIRTWCSAASTSMILAYHARRHMHAAWNLDVASVAARVRDSAYDGTGNWAMNTALAGALGLRGAVAYLRDFEHARRFIRAAIPLAISYAWQAGELPGAPIEHSEGHIAVLRGFTSKGDPILNDPAAPGICITYPRGVLERLWTRHGAIAYIIATRERSDLLELGNA